MSNDSNTTDWQEEYAYTLGVQAYIFGFPWVYLTALRWLWVGKPKPPGYTDFDMAFNHWYHSRDVITPAYQSGGSPNNDTLYSMTWLDLSKEPVVLSHPDMGDRYFTFEIASMTSDNFAYIGKRTTGGKAGSYLLAGPSWKGELPNTIVIDFEEVTFVDTTGAATVTDLFAYAQRYDVELSLARVHSATHKLLELGGVLDEIGEQRIYPTVRKAVDAAATAAAQTIN